MGFFYSKMNESWMDLFCLIRIDVDLRGYFPYLNSMGFSLSYNLDETINGNDLYIWYAEKENKFILHQYIGQTVPNEILKETSDIKEMIILYKAKLIELSK